MKADYRTMRRLSGEAAVYEALPPVVERDTSLATSALGLELTAACNAKCPGCFPQYLDLPKGFADLPFILETISNYAKKGGKVVFFTARGEPLLDKRIPDIVRYAKDCGIEYVEFTSNGQLLTEQMAYRLIRSGLDAIRFSMTGSKQEVYARWQGYKSPFQLHQVEANILRLMNLRNAMRSATPKTYVRYIYDGIDDDVDSLAYLRKWINHVDEVQFTLRLPVLKGGKAVEVLDSSDIPRLFSSGNGKVPCGSIGAVAVTSDGSVTVCASAMGDPGLTVGNLRHSPFAEVTESYLDGVARFKSLHAKGREDILPEACQGCFGIVDGGNNCQDFDILLMMTVAHTVTRAVEQAGENRPIVIVGANEFAKMCLLHAPFHERVRKVVQPGYVAPPNPFGGPGLFKGIEVVESLDAADTDAVVVVADERFEPAGLTAAAVLRFGQVLKDVNQAVFRLPDPLALYDLPWSVWHQQMHQNFYFWYLRSHIANSMVKVAVSISDVAAVDRLLQLPDLARNLTHVFSPTEAKGALRHPHCRGKDVLALDDLTALFPAGGELLVWNPAEADATRTWLVRNGLEGRYTICEYQSFIRRPKLWLEFGDLA